MSKLVFFLMLGFSNESKANSESLSLLMYKYNYIYIVMLLWLWIDPFSVPLSDNISTLDGLLTQLFLCYLDAFSTTRLKTVFLSFLGQCEFYVRCQIMYNLMDIGETAFHNLCPVFTQYIKEDRFVRINVKSLR